MVEEAAETPVENPPADANGATRPASRSGVDLILTQLRGRARAGLRYNLSKHQVVDLYTFLDNVTRQNQMLKSMIEEMNRQLAAQASKGIFKRGRRR